MYTYKPRAIVSYSLNYNQQKLICFAPKKKEEVFIDSYSKVNQS